MLQIISRTFPDGTTDFINIANGEIIGHSGWSIHIANVCVVKGWKGFGSPSYPNFLAVDPQYLPEDLVDPGFYGFILMSPDEILEFSDDDKLAA